MHSHVHVRLLTYTRACVNYLKGYPLGYKNFDRHRKYPVKRKRKQDHAFTRTEDK